MAYSSRTGKKSNKAGANTDNKKPLDSNKLLAMKGNNYNV